MYYVLKAENTFLLYVRYNSNPVWFQALESELRGRDIAVVGTNKAVNKLEVHHVTMLHDLKARIARCDAAVSKHSKDLILLMEEIRRLEGQQIGTREKLINDIHRLEAEVTMKKYSQCFKPGASCSKHC